MRITPFLVGLCISATSQAEALMPLNQRIDALIDKTLPQATVAVFVKDLQSGKVLYSKNANKLLSPASSTKLFTLAAAYYQLKPEYRFITTLSQKANDFYLTFSGSPSLSQKNIAGLIAGLKTMGINRVSGNFILDASRYAAPHYPGGTSYDDLGWYYAAPVTSAVVNANAESYDFITGDKPGLPVRIQPKSPLNSLTLINELVTVSKEEAKDHCAFNIEIKPQNTLRLYGCMPVTKQPKTLDLAVPDPNALIQKLIKKNLADNGIRLEGAVIMGKTPQDASNLASLQSADLLSMLRHMLKESDNLYANSLVMQLGYAVTGQGSQKQGVFAMKKVLAEHTHLDMTQLDLADGMGTRYNMATAEQFVTLLQDLYQDKTLGPQLMSLLPEAGSSGTLKERMVKTPLAHRVFAKTGSMHDISSLTGFLVTPNKAPLVFSIVINGINKPISKAKALEEQILLALVRVC